MSEEVAVSAPLAEPVAFGLLGPVEVHGTDGRPLELGPPQETRVLVALLDAPGRPISNPRLCEVMSDSGPEGKEGDLWKHAGALRRRLADAGLDGVLVNKRGKYQLDVDEESIDVHRFRRLVRQARDLMGTNDRAAAQLLEEAVRLRRGEPLAGLGGDWIERYRRTLMEEYRLAQVALYELAIRLVAPREVVPRLAGVYQEHPADEEIAWLYMHALHRAGRPVKALEVYDEVRAQWRRFGGSSRPLVLEGLRARIARQDPALMRPEALVFPTGGASRSMIGGPTTTNPADAGRKDDMNDEAIQNDEDPATGPAREPEQRRQEHSTTYNGPVGSVATFTAPVDIRRDMNFNGLSSGDE